jgi:hypothetical protein
MPDDRVLSFGVGVKYATAAACIAALVALRTMALKCFKQLSIPKPASIAIVASIMRRIWVIPVACVIAIPLSLSHPKAVVGTVIWMRLAMAISLTIPAGAYLFELIRQALRPR